MVALSSYRVRVAIGWHSGRDNSDAVYSIAAARAGVIGRAQAAIVLPSGAARYIEVRSSAFWWLCARYKDDPIRRRPALNARSSATSLGAPPADPRWCGESVRSRSPRYPRTPRSRDRAYFHTPHDRGNPRSAYRSVQRNSSAMRSCRWDAASGRQPTALGNHNGTILCQRNHKFRRVTSPLRRAPSVSRGFHRLPRASRCGDAARGPWR